MEITIPNNQILKVLEVLSWIIFIGLCIEAGGIIVNTIISLFVNSKGVENYWKGADYLSSLYHYDYGHFLAITFLMSIVASMKVLLFYQIIKLFIRKKVDFNKPFSLELKLFLSKLSYLTIGIGLFSNVGMGYSKWLEKQGLAAVKSEYLNIAGADVWLFMAVILFIITYIVKKGIDLQTENDLTI